MRRVMGGVSYVLGVLGLVVSAAAGVARLSGIYYVLDAEAITVFQAGTGLMVAACLLKLWALGQRETAD